MTDIRIFQGNQIGGCITMISTNQTKILIDFGASLPGAKVVNDIVFDWDKEQVDAVFFTHYHGDHIGRFMEIPEEIPLYMGEVTYKVLCNINNQLQQTEVVEALTTRKEIHFLEINRAITIGDLTITPFSVDHSAFDAYMFLVEAPDKNILHTGDFRDHGYRGHKIRNGRDTNVVLDMIWCYVRKFGDRKIDILITEGTMMGQRRNDKRYSERDLQQDVKTLMQQHRHVFVKVSSTNVDSIASFYHAAQSEHLDFYVNRYVAKQLEVYREAGQKYGASCYNFDNFRTYAPHLNGVGELTRAKIQKQRQLMKQKGFVCLINEYNEDMIQDFADVDPILIYSMWDGYIKKEIGKTAYDKKMADFCQRHKAISRHTSGHAYVELIEAVIQKVAPREKIIPIHTENADGFRELQIDEVYKAMIMPAE